MPINNDSAIQDELLPVDTQKKKFDREPLMTRAVAGAGMTLVVAILACFGIRVSQDTRDAILKIALLAAPLVPVITGLISRKHVTPNKDPKTSSGVPLVPAISGDVAATVGDTANVVVDTVSNAANTVTDVVSDLSNVVQDLGDLGKRVIPGHKK